MAQLNWTYYSLTGKPYSIDMYHGDDSGHLMLFVNSEVVLIDFKQKKANTYNFFIENQLIELAIEKDSKTYDYTITPQKMPLLGEPEKLFTKHFWIPLILLIIALNLLAVIFIK